jgi:small subunit ribosomal protein S17
MTEQHEATASRPRGNRKVRVGVVVSDKMDKTVVVEVEDIRQHRLYKKTLRRTTRLKAHDERNEAGQGDLVRLSETRPLSATKRWRVAEIIQKAK